MLDSCTFTTPGVNFTIIFSWIFCPRRMRSFFRRTNLVICERRLANFDVILALTFSSWNWMANFSPNVVRRQLFAWRTKFGEIDHCRRKLQSVPVFVTYLPCHDLLNTITLWTLNHGCSIPCSKHILKQSAISQRALSDTSDSIVIFSLTLKLPYSSDTNLSVNDP